MTAGSISHLVAAIAFLVLTSLLMVSWKGRAPGLLMVGASFVTGLWAAAAAYDYWTDGQFASVVRVTEVLRSVGWMALLWTVIGFGVHGAERRTMLWTGAAATAGLCLLVVVLDLYPLLALRLRFPCDIFTCHLYGRLAIAVIGLALVENLFRNTGADKRWNIKYLCFGVGGLFVYDVFLYANAILFQSLNAELLQARGATNALVVPLLGVAVARNRQWSLDIFLSRRVVFHSATLIGTGIYMLAMAGVGYYLREFGGNWGGLMQLGFLFGAAILLPVILFSGRFRSRVKVFLNKNFFSYKYDYRDEWLRFNQTISSAKSDQNLNSRVIQSVADIVDSPDGGLWLVEEHGRFVLAEAWNLAWPDAEEAADGPLARFLEDRQWVIDLNEYQRRPAHYAGAGIPDWLTGTPRAWLVVPLIHDERLLGFVVVGQPRAPQSLNWEDYDILKTVASQAASYIVQEQAVRALALVRQFESFNRRFAFVLHDIKNLVSQLSLMTKNAARHRDNPEFQADMIRTVEDSVGKLNRMLVRLHAEPSEHPLTTVVLAPLLRQAMGRMASGGVTVELDCQAPQLAVAAEADRLTAVVAHLVQNAVEASPSGGVVQLRLLEQGGNAVIEIEDRGPGMEPDFVRDHLFRPFKTTKGTGYGLGAYEARALAREMGGRLEADSEPGRGTKMILTLPILSDPMAAGADRRKVSA